MIADQFREVGRGAKERANRSIRAAIGLNHDPPPRCDDPEVAYSAVDGVARVVHGDLASMLIGGIASLFLQMLHPLAMAGVADHSRYREDPLGRMLQTANFIGATTYGSSERAYAAIERVRAVHEAVRGVSDDGRPYDANDPHLLAWIHCAEISMFLEGYRRFGRERLTAADCDAYVAEMAQLARDLGVESPPTSTHELRVALEAFRPELRLSANGATARDFITRGVVRGRLERLVYRVIVRASYSLLEPWARAMLGAPKATVLDRRVLEPLTHVLCRALRAVVPPAPRQVSDSPPSTSTT